MEPPVIVHPADETLVSYGLGKLDDTLAESVSNHLEQCDPCRRRVAELSSDSFVVRLREAQPRPAEAPGRPKTLVEGEPPRPSLAPEKQPSPKQPSSQTSPSSSGSLPPELVNHPQYEVLRELGRGGMGVVYLARNKLMDRLEVLKVLSKEMLGKQGRADRFLREIQSAAKLHHPNVVAAYTAFPLGETLVFAMEYVEGDDLAKLVRSRGPLPVLNACYFAYQTAQGLQHAHERGMIHRDIKPGNLILFRQGKKGTVKILDFGLAKVTSEQRIDGTLTQQGQMLGTPDYIAPEQTLDAQKADIRADIYSLGCTLYHLLTGSPPFSGNSLYEVLQAHHSVDARPLNLVRPEVPVELAAVVAKMMAKEPSRRYQTPAEVVHALKPFLKPGGLTSPQPELSQSVSEIERPSATPIAAAATPDEEEAPFFAPMEPVEPSERWKSLIDTPSLERSSTARSAIRKPPWRRPPWSWLSVAVGAAVLGLITAWASGVFSVKTKDGVIVLQDLPDNAEVLVDGDKVSVRFPEGGGPAEITVPPGKRGVQVKKDGFQAFGEEVSLASGEKKLLSVHLDALPQKASTKERDEGAPMARTGDEARMPNGAGTLSPRSSPDKKSMPRDLLVAPFDAVAAKDTQKKWAGHLGSPVMITNTTGMQMTLIPPGRFDMGSAETAEQLSQAFPAEAATKRADLEPLGERPVHRVTISKPFYLGMYEVTKRQFKQFVNDTGYRTDAEKDGKGGRGYTDGETWLSANLDPKFTWRDWGTSQSDDTPVVNVSHNDATAFCLWLSNREGKNYRLPTEAEWEYACRAGTTGRYYNGDDPEQLTKIANIRDATMKAKFSAMPTAQTAVESSDGYAFPAPVGQFAPNQFGLYDMIGNVSELCADWYDEIYYFRSPPLDPTGPLSGESRVVRGGGWGAGAFLCRIAKRQERRPDDRGPGIGFRLALSVDSSAAQGSETPSNSVREPRSTSTAAGSEDGFVPLFNGKDLSGWHVESEGSWTVQDGILVAKGSRQIGKPLRLVADQKNYRNFKLFLRILNEDSASLHAIIRFSSSDDHYDGYRIAMVDEVTSDDGAALHRGSILRAERLRFGDLMPPRKALAQPTNVAPGEWYTIEITANGNRISTAVNGAVVAEYEDPGTAFSEGGIVLAGRNDAIAHIKEIKIKELPPNAQSESGTTNAPGMSLLQRRKTPPTDADRKAAQAVLALGGSVTIRVHGEERRVESGQSLPGEAFLLLRIELHDKPELTDADLAPLEGIANLTSFDVRKVPKVTDAIIEHLQNSTGLESFWFEDARVGDAGLQYLERFTNLKSLGLENTQVSDEGLAHLERLAQLQHLALGGTRITSAGLFHVRGLNRLGTLWIYNTNVADNGLAYLQGLSNLKKLILFGTRIGDAGVAYLKGLSQLEYLDLANLQVTDVGFGDVGNLSNLKTLWIGGTRITDAGAIHLSRLSKLERLGIQGTRITDAGLLHLKNAPNLNMLLVDNTSITPAGLQALEKAKAGNGTLRKSARLSSRTAPSSRAAHFKPLFNHKDLVGWTFPFGEKSEWKVEDNTLVGAATNAIPDQSRHMIRRVRSGCGG